MSQIELMSITARRAHLLTLIATHQTQKQIAVELNITRAGVRSHVEWLRLRTGKSSMRSLGEWWQHERKPWLVEMAGAAGLNVEPMTQSQPLDSNDEHITMGPMGGLIV